uniref:Uncharacterized protein n=1 Tax=Rhizophora mucronata TaxID=61149 RepID=A0A2P2Q1L2_RHIMU
MFHFNIFLDQVK